MVMCGNADILSRHRLIKIPTCKYQKINIEFFIHLLFDTWLVRLCSNNDLKGIVLVPLPTPVL